MANPSKLRKSPEPPYGIIAPKLARGKVVPFLGAGASIGQREPADSKFDPARPRFLPMAAELAEVLADESSFPSDDVHERGDLAKVSSYYAEVSSDRKTLRERLRELLGPNTDPEPLAEETASADPARVAQSKKIKPMTLHRLLAALPAAQVIVTTNYDSLVEQAFDEVEKPYDLVIYPADRPTQYVNSVLWWPHKEEPRPVESNKLDEHINMLALGRTVIFKMHGTRHPSDDAYDHFVVTEEDYVEFLSRMTTHSAIPSIFYPYFRERSFLFLGYGLRDWNLRVLLKNLPKQTDEQLRSWAIQRDPFELERMLWQKRNVSIYDLSLEEFATKLAEKMGLSGES